MTNPNLASLSKDQLLALVAQLQAEPVRKLSLKVTEKGGASLYGLGRFPVTLYASQWDKLIANIDQIKTFIDANRSLLTVKE